MIEASTTRRLSTPYTLPAGSTTAPGSVAWPMRACGARNHTGGEVAEGRRLRCVGPMAWRRVCSAFVCAVPVGSWGEAKVGRQGAEWEVRARNGKRIDARVGAEGRPHCARQMPLARAVRSQRRVQLLVRLNLGPGKHLIAAETLEGRLTCELTQHPDTAAHGRAVALVLKAAHKAISWQSVGNQMTISTSTWQSALVLKAAHKAISWHSVGNQDLNFGKQRSS
jgi:hypothetical protein